MNIMLMSAPINMGGVGEIQDAKLVFVDEKFGLRGDKAFQEYLRQSVSLTLGIDIDEVRLPGVPEHLRRDGIQLLVDNTVFNRLDTRFGDIVVTAVMGYVKLRENHQI